MKKVLTASLVMGSFLVGINPVKATSFSIDQIDGDWINAQPTSGITINNSGSNGGLSTARWGTGASTAGQSGYDFLSAATPVNAQSDGTAFALGTFTHLNWPITGTPLDKIDLSLALEDTGIFNVTTTFNIDHNETPNSTGGPADNDIVTITNPIVNQLFTYNGQNYYFNLIGFSQNGGATISNVFSTVEGQANTATLYARITETPVNPVSEPAAMLLMSTGLAGLFGIRLRSKSKK